MSIKDYSLLPDYMRSEDIALKIGEILQISTDSSISTVDVAQAFLEMIHRQGENFGEKLPENLVLRLKKWVVDFWDASSWDLFKVTSAIIVNLDFYHFPEGYRLLESALNSSDERIRQRAEKSLSEMTDTSAMLN